MNKFKAISAFLIILFLTVPSFSQGKKVKDLKFHHMQNYCWMRLATIIPEITDRIILPIGTVEAHGAVAIGADNFIPNNLAELIWDKCNALIAPPINHGFTGQSISQFPGSITVREDIFEEYIYDVLKDLVRTGFKNILIINGHGGNTEPAKRAMGRVHTETGAHFMIVDWWKIAFQTATEVYGRKATQSGHGDMEEAALVMSYDPALVDKEMYRKLGKDNVGKKGVEAGISLLPSWATTRYPDEGEGYLDFDIKKAKKYTLKKADYIANVFLEAVKRWEMMEAWKK
ncbi:MAG: creatininase family protein [Candidatus Aminicenantes bacterium]|nr:creatininase family protein [Candidatus Aminicenantes bacterium]NIM79168.1 creatininase family protein [Candidatus Aminicenantes bacterium]NIN18453.1 creatininase family protein [Candidatus Aminicenantes bacterium]NIN42341.1 creatininase family protein [Candidatus Aminicenantes bacterium]NIN85107.1 creatininase family protein [Candidatus Aminicenantes bacterium]